MDRVYVKCCCGYSVASHNWNESFQLAMEREESTLPLAKARLAAIHRVERAFREAVVPAAKKLIEMEVDAPPAVPKELLCYREKNVLFRVLPDCRTGRGIMTAFRGLLQSRSGLLTVPLTTLVTHRGTPVLAQALVPLGPQPVKVHGEGVEPDMEVSAELERVADAVNTPLPDEVVCEVYRALDGRCYVTHTNVTTIALDDAALLGGPLKRAEMLALCPCVTASCEDALSVLRNPAVMEALLQVLDVAPEQRPRLLSDTLHFYGVNLCLLRGVLDAFGAHYGTDAPSFEAFARVIGAEMLARTIKQELYLEVQGKRLGMDEVGLNRAYALHLHKALQTNAGDAVTAIVLRKYAIESGGAVAVWIAELLQRVRTEHRSVVVERVSALVGARSIEQGEGQAARRSVTWVPVPCAPLAPRLSEPEVMCGLEPLYRASSTSAVHRIAYCLPLQIRVAVWQGRVGDALNLANTALEESSAVHGPTSLKTIAAQRTFMLLLFSVPELDNVREALSMVAPVLEVYEDRAGVITRARCHIEIGCCLLGAAAVLDVTVEATRHFMAAERLLPVSLRSAHGAWLYLQPSLGLLRCRQRGGRSVAVPWKDLVGDAMYFVHVVAPADYCTAYLWELGMELAVEHQYEDSTRLLTAAYTMAKGTAQCALDVVELRDDALRVYGEWNPAQYAAYCEAITEGYCPA